MRPIKDLLQIVLDNPQDFDKKHDGLCSWVHTSFCHERISYEETRVMLSYIQANRPSMFSSISAFTYRHRSYHWKPGRIEPRIKWIQQHIKKLSDNERKR